MSLLVLISNDLLPEESLYLHRLDIALLLFVEIYPAFMPSIGSCLDSARFAFCRSV